MCIFSFISAEELINILHNLFIDKLGIDYKQVGPIIYINGVTVQAFPSHTVATMRGYTDVPFNILPGLWNTATTFSPSRFIVLS